MIQVISSFFSISTSHQLTLCPFLSLHCLSLFMLCCISLCSCLFSSSLRLSHFLYLCILSSSSFLNTSATVLPCHHLAVSFQIAPPCIRNSQLVCTFLHLTAISILFFCKFYHHLSFHITLSDTVPASSPLFPSPTCPLMSALIISLSPPWVYSPSLHLALFSKILLSLPSLQIAEHMCWQHSSSHLPILQLPLHLLLTHFSFRITPTSFLLPYTLWYGIKYI